MTKLQQLTKQITDISTRFLPNPNVLITVLFWSVSFIYFFYYCTYGLDHDNWLLAVIIIAYLVGTTVIGLEKLINRVEDSVGLRFCAALVAGMLGFLIQIVKVGEWQPTDLLSWVFTDTFFFEDSSGSYWFITSALRTVFGAVFGLLYAVPSLAEMVEKRASPSPLTSPPPGMNVPNQSNLKKQAKQVTDIATRYLPNPKVLVTVILWTITFINIIWWILKSSEGWADLVTLIVGTAVIALEKLVNRVEDPIGLRCCAMLVAGIVGFLVQILANSFFIWWMGANTSPGSSNWTFELLVRVVIGAVYGLLYAIVALAEMVEKRG